VRRGDANQVTSEELAQPRMSFTSSDRHARFCVGFSDAGNDEAIHALRRRGVRNSAKHEVAREVCTRQVQRVLWGSYVGAISMVDAAQHEATCMRACT